MQLNGGKLTNRTANEAAAKSTIAFPGAGYVLVLCSTKLVTSRILSPRMQLLILLHALAGPKANLFFTLETPGCNCSTIGIQRLSYETLKGKRSISACKPGP